jgi:hypothetical protein
LLHGTLAPWVFLILWYIILEVCDCVCVLAVMKRVKRVKKVPPVKLIKIKNSSGLPYSKKSGHVLVVGRGKKIYAYRDY